MPARPAGGESLWSPLRLPLYRSLWIAALASNMGTWIQDVGAGWLMTSLSPSPLMVGLVQAALTLPIFLFALPAGALADVVDRRLVLLWTQGLMAAAAAALAALSWAGTAGPWTLLSLTFALGVGMAFTAPAWQAIIPELVSPGDLVSALALNGAGINMARAVGPALGGALVSAVGPHAAFALNAVSFTGVLMVLARWRRPPRRAALPAERIVGAMAAGVRYVRHAPELRTVMLRSASFIFFGSALWALMPVVARFELGLAATGYGALLGCLGAGAVAGAWLLPRLRRSLGLDALAGWSTGLFGLVLALVAVVREPAAMGAVMVMAGGAWITLLTSFHMSAQAVLPSWVRGRGLAVYLLVFFGGMASGSAVWGAAAARSGVRPALLAASAGSLLALAVLAHRRLATGEGLDLAPSRHWPAPVLSAAAELERGPVLVTVAYEVAAQDEAEFIAAMLDLRRVRLRDGAVRWDLFEDQAVGGRFLETFLVESWAEHLRQHERLTVSDRGVEQRARSFHRGAAPPLVTHYLAAPARRRGGGPPSSPG
ncbi:MAG TPA: MFS transporter [Candidatus Polarisedimenticolia bacterium]|nr:MFS transporter [Candidatus Polarisedimenticolia bacterium]